MASDSGDSAAPTGAENDAAPVATDRPEQQHPAHPQAAPVAAAAAGNRDVNQVFEEVSQILGPNTRTEHIADIVTARKAVNQQKRKLTNELKLEKRRKARSLSKANKLSDLELLDAMRERQIKKAKLAARTSE